MSVLQAIVLGIIQGLTEFVPVSSSGHLVVVPEALGWSRPGLAFDVLLHAGSLLALLVYFRRDLWGLARGLFGSVLGPRRTVGLLAVATIPAVVAALTLERFFEERFDDPATAAASLFITAAVLVIGERAVLARRRWAKPARSTDDLRVRDAAAIGLAQAGAILPGISRSGSTIATGLVLGLDRSDAARFAFLLAIPALVGASVFQLPELSGVTLGSGAGVAGFVASTLTSYVAVWGLLRYLRNNTLYPFAAYCVAAGIIFSLIV